MNLTFSTNLKESLTGVDFVQENGPERVDLKLKLFKDISDAVGKDVVIASSSSGIPVSNFQAEATNPAGIFAWASFQPTTRRPVSRICRRQANVPLKRAVKFDAHIGKKPIRMV